jgi:hypothetical protein
MLPAGGVVDPHNHLLNSRGFGRPDSGIWLEFCSDLNGDLIYALRHAEACGPRS